MEFFASAVEKTAYKPQIASFEQVAVFEKVRENQVFW